MKRLVFYILFFSVLSVVLCAQEEVLDNKARYENFLAGKLENAITKILGPGQVKVLVDVTMDYSKIEKVEYEREKGQKKSFALEGEAGDTSGVEYLMPGFQIPKVDDNKDFVKSYTRQLMIPSNLIKKIKVSLIVNETLSDNVINSITNLSRQVLSLDEKRGDEVIVIKSFFAPVWKTIWYDPQSLSFIMKYLILSVVGIISLLIVALGFLKLAGAMNTMAKVQQTHQITMEVQGAQTPSIAAELSRPQIEFTKQKEETDTESGEKIYFNIKPYQIDALVNLMIKEEPSNVAIVVDHLRDDIKKEFMSRLPDSFASEVIAGLSQIRFIDKDTIMTLKEELEARLDGVTGGLKNTIELLSRMGWLEKSRIVKNISEKYPELYVELKKHILLFDDLKYFSQNDISIIISATNIEDWANVMGVVDDELKEKLKAEFSQTAWKIIEEKSKGEITSQRTENSITNIMTSVEKLIDEGRIKKPEINVAGFIDRK